MDKVKRAHLMRAKKQYDDPETETPGSFEEYFSGQYVKEYGEESAKRGKKMPKNGKVIARYLEYLAGTRDIDKGQNPGLLSLVQTEEKGGYPSNPEEDKHFLQQVMKFVHHKETQSDVVGYLKSSSKDIVEPIAKTAAQITAKLASEIRKQREFTDEAQTATFVITVEELWTIAKNLGMKNVSPELVMNSVQVGAAIYNQLDEKMGKRGQMEKMQEGPPQGMNPEQGAM